MGNKKLSKEQMLEYQAIEKRKYNRATFLILGITLLFLSFVLVFHTYWIDTKYVFRKYFYYKKEVPKEITCMSGNRLKHHETEEFSYKSHTFFLCNESCYKYLINHYEEVAYAKDAISGDSIVKSNAIIGIKEKGEPSVIYFKDKQNFHNYYKEK